MPKPKQLANYHTIHDIAGKVEKSPYTIRHYIRVGILPPPAVRLTIVRFIGNFIKSYTISLWNNRQVNKLLRQKHLISRGRYKKDKHPIKKKK